MSTTQIFVTVIPHASKNSVVACNETLIKIKIKAVPEDGKANKELIAFLAKSLKIPKSAISLLSGATSREKKLAIHGLTFTEIQQRLSPLLSS